MPGLKICTRWRAISARRRRRMSSSLLPLNMGPQTTSIHPMLRDARFMESLLSPRTTSLRQSRVGDGGARQFTMLAAEELFRFGKVGKYFGSAAQDPATDLLDGHSQHEINRDTAAAGQGQVAV